MGDEYWEGYFDDDPVETDELDEWGCLFGDKCLMPGDHLKKECHTAEIEVEYLSSDKFSKIWKCVNPDCGKEFQLEEIAIA